MAQPVGGTVGHFEKVRAIAASARLFFVGGTRATGPTEPTEIAVFNHNAEKSETSFEVPAHVTALVATDAHVIAACADGNVRVFEHDGKPVREIEVLEGVVTSIAVRGDDLLTGGSDGTLRLFGLKSGKKKKEWTLAQAALRAVAIDPAGEAYAAGGDDGTIRIVRSDADEPHRTMPGHDGPVRCVSFTPADGRLVSGGEDGTVRVWYLVGTVEFEIRNKDDALHVGGATALLFPPTKNPAELGDRLISVGEDGKLRVFRMSERRKPRTFELSNEPLSALAWLPANKPGTLGSVVTAGDGRTVHGVAFDAEGAPSDRTFAWAHGFDVLTAALAAPAKAGREEAIRSLAPMREREALELLVKQLGADRDPELRALIASELAAHDAGRDTTQRATAKKAVRARLDDEHRTVREAALASLQKLEAESPLSPLRSAIESKFADVRTAALRLLHALASTSPLAAGIIASRLADDDASVRAEALKQLVAISPPQSVDPLRAAFERGRSDVRSEALVRGAASGLTKDPAFTPLVGKALDDEDAEVRRVAFVVSAISRPGLAAWLKSHDEAFARAVNEVVKRAAPILGIGGKALPPEVDPELVEVKGISAAFVQTVHPKLGSVSIFQPKIHTPIKVGDKIHLINIKSVGPEGHAQLRATDYLAPSGAAAASDADLDRVHAQLFGAKVAPSTDEQDREPLLAALACRTPDTALRGARGLALLGDMRALGALLTISREPTEELRRDAATALVALEDPRAKRRLAWMLNDADASVRATALGCYAKLEADALAVAEAALHSSHEDIRVRGLDVLVKEGKGKAETLLGDAIEDEAAKVRTEAFRTLWSWHDADPFIPLDRALTARFPDLRTRAVEELKTLTKDGAKGAAALERLEKTIADRDLSVARAAYDAVVELHDKAKSAERLQATRLAGIASTHPSLRAKAAEDTKKSRGITDAVRSALSKLLEDTESAVRVAAVEALDALLPTEPGAVAVGLQSSHLDLRVRAAELLAVRREESMIEPMRALLLDTELKLRIPPQTLAPLRQRAASALADLGSPRLLKWFATVLVKDEDPIVREQAARGLSNASRRGEEGYLLDLLGHEEVAIRSWAAEGLARLGDARALPVLTGTLRHEHAPIRVGAILSFAALGPEGYGGMLQGLEDASRDVQRVVLSVILARDLRAFRRQETPDLLTSALSSERPEVRFAAARALELRIDPAEYTAFLVELLMPERPERAEAMARWPDEETRARFMVGLAEALAGDRPEQRYAAAQALKLRDRPIDYFREVQRAVAPRSIKTPWVPDTTPRAPVPAEDKPKKGPLALLRRLFASGAEAEETQAAPTTPAVPSDEQQRLRLLAFGAYVGLLRQATSDDEAHRTRRDAIDRIVELTLQKHVSLESAAPALARALDDPNHLVRQAAFAALKKVYPSDPETPLALALASSSADVIRAALDELAARGDAAKPRIAKALDSHVAQARKYAFDLLEKLSPPGSLEPLLAALASDHADIRIGVIERLATSQDARVATALIQALESDHDDLRLRAAELLAQRRDDRAADALGPWLRAEDAQVATRARAALSKLGTPAAVRALRQRLEDEVPADEAVRVAAAIAETRAGVAAIDALATLFGDEHESVRRAAVDGCLEILGSRSDVARKHREDKPRPRDANLSARVFEAASRSRYADVRASAARELDDLLDGSLAGPLLTAMFTDRDRGARALAVASYAKHVEHGRLPARPLEDVLRGGARETMLSAAWGLAHAKATSALRPLLLFARAGEDQERERALRGLGILGDKRALPELEVIANGGTEEAPAEPPMQAAALEGLGLLLGSLDSDDRERVRDKIESSLGVKDPLIAVAAIRALKAIGGDRATARIATILAEPSSSTPEVIEATRALGKLGDIERAEPVLKKALDSYVDEARWEARWALEELLPQDRTRIEFLAVESEHDDLSEPAATYLADEGDAGLVLAKLTKLSNDLLRSRLCFGLVRRAAVPTSEIEKLLGHATPEARADAAFVAAGRAKLPETKALAPAIAAAAKRAADGYLDAKKSGRDTDAEERAWLYAVWAARVLDAAVVRADARRWLSATEAPAAVRVESALALHGGGAEDRRALEQCLGDPETRVRTAAASSLSPTDAILTLAKKTTPLDPVRLGLAAEGAPVDRDELASAEGRRILMPLVWREAKDADLLALASKPGKERIDYIDALGRSATAEAIEALTELASEDMQEDDVRMAAFRALRRAQRTQARRARATSKGAS